MKYECINEKSSLRYNYLSDGSSTSEKELRILLLTFTGMQNMMSTRSAVARPPRKTLVGVAGSGRSRGQRVEAIITTFPERNRDLSIRSTISFLGEVSDKCF